MTIRETEALLQRAYDFSTGRVKGQLELPEEIEHAGGFMDLHYAYYNSGLAGHPEIRDELKINPQGQLAQLIRALRDWRLQKEHYTKETLNAMYGLID